MQSKFYKIKTIALAVIVASASSSFANHHKHHNHAFKKAVHHGHNHMHNHMEKIQLKQLNLGSFEINDFSMIFGVNNFTPSLMQFDMDGVAFKDVKFDAVQNIASGKFEIEKVALYGLDNEGKNKNMIGELKGFSAESDLAYNDKTHTTGSFELNINKFMLNNIFSKKGPRTVDVEKVEISGKAVDKDDRTNGKGEIYFKKIKIDNWNIGPFDFKYDFNVDRDAYTQYIHFMKDMQKLKHKMKGRNLTPDQHRQISSWVFRRGQQVAMAFIHRGIDFNVDKLTLKTNDGTIKANVKFHVDDMRKTDKPNVVGDLFVEAPDATVMKLLTVFYRGNAVAAQQRVNSWLNQGFVIKKGKTLSMKATYDDGKFTVNGKELAFKPRLVTVKK